MVTINTDNMLRLDGLFYPWLIGGIYPSQLVSSLGWNIAHALKVVVPVPISF